MAPKKKKGAKGKKKKKAAKGEGDEEKKENEEFKVDLPHFGWVKITVSCYTALTPFFIDFSFSFFCF